MASFCVDHASRQLDRGTWQMGGENAITNLVRFPRARERGIFGDKQRRLIRLFPRSFTFTANLDPGRADVEWIQYNMCLRRCYRRIHIFREFSKFLGEPLASLIYLLLSLQ